MTMTKNICLDRLYSKQAGTLKLVHSNYREKGSLLSKQIEARDSISWVKKIMDELSYQQKMVLQLRDVEAYYFTDIAKILDMKPTAVRLFLYRIRKKYEKN